MPELPEVHTILEELRQAGVSGKTIKSAHVFWPKTVAIPSVEKFLNIVKKKTILNLSRRGKHLIFHLSGGYDLIVHLRMTGRLLLVSADEPMNPYIRLTIEFDHQQLRFHDTRKFGRWYLVPDAQKFLNKLGLEPLDEGFSLGIFKKLIQNKKRALKPLLLDQTFVAGLGNIYVDEALWEAKLHPLRKGESLTDSEVKKLHQAIIDVLQRGIKSQGTTLGKGKTNYYRLKGERGSHQTLLNVFRQTGHPCPRCGCPIERLVIAQRSTHICPKCQVASAPSSILD